MGLGDNILDAVDALYNQHIKSAKFDKTIQGTIIECTDSVQGKYKVKYQGGAFFAFYEDTSVKLNDGITVYVLIPEGDFSKKKIIQGAVSKDNIDVKHIVSKDDRYVLKTNDCIYDEKDYPYMYKSYGTIESNNILDTLYDKSSFENRVQVNNADLKTLASDKEITGIKIAAKFYTNIKEPQSKGDFGLLFTVAIKTDEKDDSGKNKIEEIQCPLNVSKMIGSPYSQINWVYQRTYIDIDPERFVEIRRIQFYTKDFKLNVRKYLNKQPSEAVSDEEYKSIPADIGIQDIELFGVKEIDDATMSSLYINIKSNYTTLNDSHKEILATAEILKNGQEQKIESAEYYWFKQHPDVTASMNVSDKTVYNEIGGEGWEFLSKQGNSYTITKDSFLTESQKYRCYVKYTPKNASAETPALIYGERTFHNSGYKYAVKVSASIDKFTQGGQTSDLECTITKGWSPEEQYRYVWTGIIDGIYSTYDVADSKFTFNSNTMQKTATMYCSVYKIDSVNGDIYIGCDSVDFYFTEDESDLYDIVFENAPAVYLYDEQGNAPVLCDEKGQLLKNNSGEIVSMQKDSKSVVCKAITFKINDSKNNKIVTAKEALNGDQSLARWCILHDAASRMIIPLGTVEEYADRDFNKIALSDDGNEKIVYDVYRGESFSYSIDKKYSSKKLNGNAIYLLVDYNGNQVVQNTEIICTKTGDPGTNGTGYYLKIVPYNDAVGSIYYHNVVLSQNKEIFDRASFSDEQSDGTAITEKGNEGTKWLKVQLWKDGQLLYDGKQGAKDDAEYNVTWSLDLPPVKYVNKEYQKLSNFLILDESNNSGICYIQYNKNIEDKGYLYNIIKAKVERKETVKNDKNENVSTIMNFATAAPIGTINVKDGYDIELVNNSGFNYIKYATGGTDGSFDNNDLFEFYVTKGNEEITTTDGDLFVKYNWSVQGYSPVEGRYIDYLKINQSNNDKAPQITLNKNEVYDGSCTSVALYCEIAAGHLQSETFVKDYIIGTIHLPIYTYLNTSGFSSLNSWDGQNIEINNDGGYILAPQVGAGEKNAANQFTGVLMGKMIDYSEDNPKTYKGMLGFNEGIRTIFLDAENGSAHFGAKSNRIDIDGNSAVISGGDYTETKKDVNGIEIKGHGMQIKMSEETNSDGTLKRDSGPSIRYGNDNFVIDKDGIMTCHGAQIYGDFISKGTVYALDNGEYKLDENGNKIIQSEHDVWFKEDEGFRLEYNELNKVQAVIGTKDVFSEMKTYQGTAMFIDMSEPSIYCYGPLTEEEQKEQEEQGGIRKPTFSVNKTGRMTCMGADITGSFRSESKSEESSTAVSFNNYSFSLSHNENYKDSQNTVYSAHISSSGGGSFQFLKTWKELEENENGVMELVEKREGITYSNGSLSITGSINATRGTIGGWEIGSNMLSAKNGRLKLFADGRIVGSNLGGDNDSTVLSSQDGDGLIEIKGRNITAGTIYTDADMENNTKGYVYITEWYNECYNKFGKDRADGIRFTEFSPQEYKDNGLGYPHHGEPCGHGTFKESLSAYNTNALGQLSISSNNDMELASENGLNLHGQSSVSIGVGSNNVAYSNSIQSTVYEQNALIVKSKTRETVETPETTAPPSLFGLCLNGDSTTESTTYLVNKNGQFLGVKTVNGVKKIVTIPMGVPLINEEYEYIKATGSGSDLKTEITIAPKKMKELMNNGAYSAPYTTGTGTTITGISVRSEDFIVTDKSGIVGYNKKAIGKEEDKDYSPALKNTYSQSLVGAINEISGHPTSVKYIPDEEHSMASIVEIWENSIVPGEVITKTYVIQISNMNQADEKVEAIIFPDGSKMTLLGFFDGVIEEKGEETSK